MKIDPRGAWLARNGVYLILLLAFALRVAATLQGRGLQAQWDEVAYINHANEILTDLPAYRDLLRPPLYPLYLAASFFLFGSSRLATGLGQALVSTVTVAVLYNFTRTLFARRDVALVAALLGALYLESITLTRIFLSETLFICLSVIGFTLAVRAWRSGRLRFWFGAGVMIALAALTREVLAYFAVSVLPLWAILVNLPLRWRLLAPLGMLFAGLVLVFTPWVVRNWTLEKRLILSTTHSEIDLLRDNWRVAARADPANQPPESMGKHVRKTLAKLPPGQRTLFVYTNVLDVIRRYPAAWLVDKLRRVRDLWRPAGVDERVIRFEQLPKEWQQWVQVGWGNAMVGLLLLATLGLFLAPGAGAGAPGTSSAARGMTSNVDAPKLMLLLYLLYSVAIFLMTHYFGRFRVPLVVLFLPYAALALVEIVGWLRAPSLQGWKRHRARVLVAGCLLVLTVVLAFG